MTRSTALRLTLAAGLTVLLVGCGGGGGAQTEATPTAVGEITENAGYQAPELTEPPSEAP